MSATQPILESVRQRLQTALPDVVVELFPDEPDKYRFMHPKGAILVAYPASRYKKLEDIGLVVQERQLALYFTIFSRSLHGELGGLYLLDALRLALTGFAPADGSPCHLLDDGFLNQRGGTWQHFLRAQTETEQVQAVEEKDLAKFIRMRLRQSSDEPAPI